MKRSKALKLSLMGASALTLVACDNSQEVGVFETLDQCIDQAGFSRDICEANQKKAQSEHVRVAPKYTSISDCETDLDLKNVKQHRSELHRGDQFLCL